MAFSCGNVNMNAMSDFEKQVEAKFDKLLSICIDQKSSDLHLASDMPPFLRTQGLIAPIPDEDTLSQSDLERFARFISRDINQAPLEKTGSLDGALSAKDGTRFRFNIFKRSGTFSIALRRLEEKIRTLSELGLPDNLYDLANLRDGLVLLAGPTGCGKSTTLATLIDRINRTRQCHVVTIEDPVEYIHPSKRSLVQQRQIGTDASTFNDALVAAMRQDPDVILVGEIREIETIRTAITAAETGHLVFATVHAGDCVGSIDRLVSVFPVDEQSGIRRQLSMVLRSIIAQHLVVADGFKHKLQNGFAKSNGHANNKGFADTNGTAKEITKAKLVLASEVLTINSAVSNLIVQGKDAQIYSMMETGSSDGMYTLEENLAGLFDVGEISERTARALCKNPNVLFNRIRRRSNLESR